MNLISADNSSLLSIFSHEEQMAKHEASAWAQSSLHKWHLKSEKKKSSPAPHLASILLTKWPTLGLLNAVMNTLGTKQDNLSLQEQQGPLRGHQSPRQQHHDFPVTFSSQTICLFCGRKPVTHILMSWKCPSTFISPWRQCLGRYQKDWSQGLQKL